MQSFLTSLIECSISMSVLVLFYIAITPWLSKKYASKWIYYVWLIIVVGFVIPFRLHFGTPLINIDTSNSHILQIIPGKAGSIAENPIQNGVLSQGVPFISWYETVGCLWILGAVVFIAYNGLKHYRFIRLVKRWGQQDVNPHVFELLQNIKGEMGISKYIRAQICLCISSPMMIGFVNPVILLPSADYTEDELSFILRHEMSHFKRKDLWYKCLVFLATAIHWFNPVIYLMAKNIAVQCEISCDAEVVRDADIDRRRQYCETIIGVIKNQSRMQTAFSTNFYGGRKGMKNRIFSIMDTTKKKTGVFLFCLVIIGTMGTGTAVAANNPQIAKNTAITTNKVIMISQVDKETGKKIISTDGGSTWIDETQYNALHAVPKTEWYTYDEYKAWLEQEKKDLQGLVGSGDECWTPTEGKFVWTQERVDKAIRQYEKILQDIKNGLLVSKPVGQNGRMIFSSNIEKTKAVHGFSFVIKSDTGEAVTFGPYSTKEELMAKVKAYTKSQVTSGLMTQGEADKILSKCK